jgi:hypothetical protein
MNMCTGIIPGTDTVQYSTTFGKNGLVWHCPQGSAREVCNATTCIVPCINTEWLVLMERFSIIGRATGCCYSTKAGHRTEGHRAGYDRCR